MSTGRRNSLTVVALGGNAILQRGEHGTFDEQIRNVQKTMAQVAEIVTNGQRILLTHGNGPQIGASLIRQEIASHTLPAFPLHACGAETQGFLGYLIQQSLQSELARRGVKKSVATIVTQVTVDGKDPAFENPTKPIGPFYTERQAKKMSKERKDLVVRQDAGRGYRRLVPSPEPKMIQEAKAVLALLKAGIVVVACGGGGIPIVRRNASFHGVDAVIDKDLAAERLATSVKADTLAIMTDVDGVFLNYRRPSQRLLSNATARELQYYANKGHFASGSMGPKVEAVTRFINNGGKRAVIGHLNRLMQSILGKAGTQIT